MLRLVTGRHDNRFAAVIVFAAVIGAIPGQALAQNVEARPWSEILVVVGHDIGLSLPDGYIEGRAVAVTPDALEIDVQKTSNSGAYPIGPATIARPLVSVIRVRKSDGLAPRTASQTIGQSAAFAGFAGAFGLRGGIRRTLTTAGVLLGASTVGAVVGRHLDNRNVETLIRIVPEPTPRQ